MKKSAYSGGPKEIEKLRQENKKIKEEFEKYKESATEKLKDLDNIISQNERLKKENDEIKKKLSKINNTNTSQNQSIPQKPIDRLKNDLYNKEATISLILKQKDFLLSIITRLTNLNIKNKINKEVILSQIDEKNIDKEKDKEKLINDIINAVQEGKKNLNSKNIEFSLSKNSFSFEIVMNRNSKVNSSKNNRKNNSNNNNSNEKNNYKKEAELIRKINEMLGIIKKKKELLKSKKNSLSFRVGTIKEGK